jgi:murein DD-endopeptidase MepM/ murein hydrolase activator NlpD/beta-lactamase regulating signal transducer with metallopeptidase domain
VTILTTVASEAICAALLTASLSVAAAAVLYRLARSSLGARARHGLAGLLLAATAAATVADVLWRLAIAGRGELEGNLGGATTGIADGTAIADAGSVVAASPESAGWGSGVVATLWLVGMVVLALRPLLGWWTLRRWLARAARPLPEPWLARCRAVASELGLGRTQFVASLTGEVPFTFGWLRPVVVLPLGMLSGIPPDLAELVVIHELTHVLRRDFLAQWVQRVAEAILFFHPLAWWLSREMSVERELACDAAVVAGGHDARRYARALTELEALRPPRSTWVLAASGPPSSNLMQRIVAILSPSPPPTLRGAALACALVGASVCAVVACGTADGPRPELAGPARALATDGDQPLDDVGSEAPSIVWLPANVRRHEAAIRHAAHLQGVPSDVLALMVLVESGGDPNAVSSVGARGLMQLMPATATAVAASHGIALPADDEALAGDLLDPRRSLELGAALVGDLIDQHGDDAEGLTKVWASYNAGSRAVARHLEDGAALPEETQRYVALLSRLHAERHAPQSIRYRQWRHRVRDRVLGARVAPLRGHVSSAYGPRSHPVSKSRDSHEGVDVVGREGDSIVAPMPGLVTEAGDSGDPRGLVVVVHHRGQLETRYHHLSAVDVVVGQRVTAGQALGTVGSTGVSTGPHLHLELRDQGEAIDPAVLVPD